MFTADHATDATMTTKVPSLAEVRARIEADASVPEGRRRDIVSALLAMGKALGRPLEVIPADPVHLRDAVAPLTAAMVGLKSGRWRNIRSLTTTAFIQVGIVVVPSRISSKPNAAWLIVLALLGDGVGRGFHLWRFARYCSQLGHDPQTVTDATIARYEQDLTIGSLVSDPKRAAREAALAWNRAVAEHASWPRQILTIPDNRNVFAPDWSVYPPSLLADIERWFARQTDRRLFNGRPGKPLKAASVNTNRRHLRAYLGALVDSGTQPADLIDLSSVVVPERAAIALNYFWQKGGEQASVYCYKHAQLVLAIARHHVKLSADQIKALEAMMADLKPAGGRMTERNVQRLRQLEDPDKMERLLTLPYRLVARAGRLGPSVSTARDVQTAAMIELLLHLPMRIGNLRGLRLGAHVNQNTGGHIRITVSSKEVKNGVPIDATLSKAVSDLLVLYTSRYRPLLALNQSDHLFPGHRAGTPKCEQAIRSQIQRTLAKHVGIVFHPHLFRHLAAYMILRENPQAHGMVQRLLGHTSVSSTITFYSGLETDAAIQHHDALIARQRQAGPRRGARR